MRAESMLMPELDEQRLCDELGQFPLRNNYRYEEQTERDLRQLLCRSLVRNDEHYLSMLFDGCVPAPQDEWSVSAAQGWTEGMEYTEAARGKPCGHIFKTGHLSFRCKTCSDDDTAALCMRCFEASDHAGHVVSRNISSGNTGCCDCGDEEAWKHDIRCGIHSAEQKPSSLPVEPLPDAISQSITATIGRALDYVIDVLSCSPENLRSPRTEDSVRQDEQQSRLTSAWYDDRATPFAEFALVLWNDEKHTIVEVENQVARACKKRRSFGRKKANETNDYGRSVIEHSTDLPLLLKMATIIEQIRITVTVRSSRDTFREQMCGTIIDWLNDLSGCSLGPHLDCFRQCLCTHFLQPWRLGSQAINKEVAQTRLDDHEIEDHDEGPFQRRHALQHLIIRAGNQLRIEEDLEQSDEEGRADSEMEVDDVMDHFTIVPDDESSNSLPEVFPVAADSEESSYDATTHGAYHGVPARINMRLPPARNIAARKAPQYWLQKPQLYHQNTQIPLEEDLSQRLRLDWLLLYDLRLWKTIRVALRDLYITTLVAVPTTKRIFGLRFAGLYNVLGQLFLVADREPDLSVVNLSLQFLTTPSVTREIIEKGNFLTTVFSMLYSFLTQRHVQHPWEVSAGDSGYPAAISNRRTLHFFWDIRYLLATDYVKLQLQNHPHYQLQFLDLLRLPQGICPNVRAVTEHVEFESDGWLSAQILTKEINRLCRQFGEAFTNASSQDMMVALRTVAKAVLVNSMGWERWQFPQAELKSETRFQTLRPFFFDPQARRVVDFKVEDEAMSFHHALHYALSWLLESCKDCPKEQVLQTLQFSGFDSPEPSSEEYLLAMFDVPVRVLAWLSQMRVGMWVRNGLSLRHQMANYRSAGQRDYGYRRDLFLLQASLVLCDASLVLANVVTRFGLDEWVRGNYEGENTMEMAEEFLHLLVICLSEPIAATTQQQARREIVQILCFKEMTFSELDLKFGNSLDDHQDVLQQVSNYRAPEGMSDSGTFTLRPEIIGELDPYSAYYNRNQRDEAEAIWKQWKSAQLGIPVAQVVFEPSFRVNSGLFANIGQLVSTLLFTQILFACLHNPRKSEPYLHVVLHLVLVALMQQDNDMLTCHILSKQSDLGITVFDLLHELLPRPQVHRIFAILQDRQPIRFQEASALYARYSAPAETAQEDDRKSKKQAALDRQAKVMAQFKQQQNAFLANQDDSSEAETSEETTQGQCILCQEQTNCHSLYGTFGMMTRSSTFRTTNGCNSATVQELQDLSLKLSRGVFPRTMSQFKPDQETTFLNAESPVSSGCGHIMHHRCFERFYVATAQRQQMQIARQHPERLDLKEFVCPLCKALGNAFLPIIWKRRPRDELAAVPQHFSSWLESGIGPSAMRFFKSPGRKLNADHVGEIVHAYLDSTMMQKLQSPRGKHSTGFDIEEELYAAFSRLRVTLMVTKMSSDRAATLLVLLKTFAGSISSAEIAQRGQPSECIWTECIAGTTLSHLQVLGETIKSMVAASLIRFHDLGVTSSICYHFVDKCLTQMFVGHPQLDIDESHLRQEYSPGPALLSDTFEILVQCSVLLVPTLRLDVQHFIWLCYLAETVKAVVFVSSLPGVQKAQADEEAPSLIHYLLSIWQDEVDQYPKSGAQVAQAVLPYVLVFLRKTALLLHVSHNTALQSGQGVTELERLCSALRLPSLDDMHAIIVQSSVLEHMIRGWIRHLLLYQRLQGQDKRTDEFVLDAVKIGHPSAYELIRLPESFDKLAYEITLRRCKSTGGSLVDGSLCLFCGAFLCSQALCCSDHSEGGCNLHMESCGRDVGLFLNIRKCMVLYLHNGRGSWNTAPYLDQFGEADPCFRHGRQLTLSQKRYDRLYRDVWLQHGIPSFIARRLDADVNNGGWETM